jgi:hypothetical protein
MMEPMKSSSFPYWSKALFGKIVSSTRVISKDIVSDIIEWVYYSL